MRITRFPLLIMLAFAAVAGIVLTLVIFFPGSVSGAAQTSAHPRPMQPASGITPKTNAAIAFSTQDVQQYVLTHEFPSGAVVPGHTIKILSIKLMTRQQADEQGHELGAYSTTKWVYVVTVEGPFYTTYVKSPVNSSQTVPQGYEVFDAHTGDTLEWGIP
ncbi:MAG: hypothetical protein WCD86_26905 [Ktedonobacteraceae bacterium]